MSTTPDPSWKRHVRIHLDAIGGKHQVAVDGTDITSMLNGLTLSVGQPHYEPHVQLSLAAADIDVDGQVAIHMEAKTVAALEALGWTAPDGDPEALRESASRLLTAANEAEAGR